MEKLYFIALVPPQPIYDRIVELKQEVAARFDSWHALKSPPHITLHMPFKWKDKRINELYNLINGLNNRLQPFELTLLNFDFFEPRVIFVNIVENTELDALQKKTVDLCRKNLNLDNANYRNQPFHPHMTIGFRDLKKQKFYAAKDHFEKQSLHFKFYVEKVELLKHNGEKWEIKKI